MKKELLVHRQHPDAILPRKHYTDVFEDAAFDLFCIQDLHFSQSTNSRILADTGLSVIVPAGYWLKFHDRSGLAAKYGIHVLGGVIDPGYTGTLKVILHLSCNNTAYMEIKKGMAIAQFTLEKINPAEIVEIDASEFEYERSLRERTEAGFGSGDEKTK